MARFVRLGETTRQTVQIEVNGLPVQALEGDTLMVAILTNQSLLRRVEFGAGARAGFCLMAACQDCWVWTPDGGRIRACSTTVTEGMQVSTHADASLWALHV